MADHCDQKLIYVGYHAADAPWFERLEVVLKPRLRATGYTLWTRDTLVPGSLLDAATRAAYDQARVAVILVSFDYLGDEALGVQELRELVDRAVQGQLHLLWIPVGMSSVTTSLLGRFQGVFRPNAPLNALSGAALDRAWLRIADVVTAVLDQIARRTALPSPGSAWRALTDTAPMGMKVRLKPVAGMSFGENDYPHAEVPRAVLYQGFWFEAEAPWAGEAVMVAAHQGVWHAIDLVDRDRVIAVAKGAISLPPVWRGTQIHLRERTSPGRYRYLLLLYRDRMPESQRALFQGSNPLQDATLDEAAQGFLSLHPTRRVLVSAVIDIVGYDTR